MKVPKELETSTGLGFTCPVCKKALSTIDPAEPNKGSAFWRKSCRHRMHPLCLTKWRQRNLKCPVPECKSKPRSLLRVMDTCDKITTVLFWSVWPILICALLSALWRSYASKPKDRDLLCEWTCSEPKYATSGMIHMFRHCMPKCKPDDVTVHRADEWTENFARAIAGPPMHTVFHPETCPLYHEPGCHPSCYAACGLHTNAWRCRYYCERICCETLDFKRAGMGEHWTTVFAIEVLPYETLHWTRYDPEKEASCYKTCEQEEDFLPCNYIARCPRQCYIEP